MKKLIILLMVLPTLFGALPNCAGLSDYDVNYSIGFDYHVPGAKNPIRVQVGGGRLIRASGKTAKEVQPVQP
jgi:hypothetical protein